eukprot:s1124_g11.t1
MPEPAAEGDEEKEKAAERGAVRGRHSTESMQQDSRSLLIWNVVHVTDWVDELTDCSGDLVLLKVYLRDSEGYVEAATNTQARCFGLGYIRGSGMHATLEVEGVDDFHTGTVDVRDFIFVVVEQLSYNAQKDLLKKKKQLYQEGLDPSSAFYALQLRSLEERAKMEAEQNLNKQHSKPRPIYYGEPLQLQHLRTGRFVRVRAKASAPLQPAARMVELQDAVFSCFVP